MSRAALAYEVKSVGPSKAKSIPGGLRVNRPGDSYEHEADRAAEQVVSGAGRRASWSLSKVSMGTPLQRECSCGGECEECKHKKEQMLQREAQAGVSPVTAPPVVHDVLRGPGRPLDPRTRSFMESRFGYDFRGVRIFHDDAAASSARAVSANAYTVGEKIVFNRGRYAPDSNSGRRLLAHELAHVVQQSRGGAPPAAGDPALEGEAGRISGQVDSPGSTLGVRQSSGVGIARDPAPAGQTLIEVKFPDGVKQLTQEQFAEQKRRALSKLRSDLNLTIGLADNGRQSQESMLAEYQGGVESLWDVVKKPKALIGIAADMKAGVTPPYIGAWANAKHAAENGTAACDQGDLATAARFLRTADSDFRDAMHNWNAYREATIGGAEGVISNLETVRDVSFAIALVAGAAVAAPVIAAGVGAGGLGLTGATATVLTTGGTALVTGAGGAVLGGGSTAVASFASTGKVDVKAVKADVIKFGKQGVVTGLTAGLGSSLNVAAKGAKLAQPFVQAAAKRCLTEAGVNVAGEVTTELLDKAVPAPGAKEEQEGGPKPLVPGPARAALTGCVSGVLGVPVAKLGRTGGKVTELAVGAGVGYADARLSGQSNADALLAAGQNVLTSAAVAHGHAGTEHAKAMKAAQSHEGAGIAPKHEAAGKTKPMEAARAAPAEAKGGAPKLEEHAADHAGEPPAKSATEKFLEKQKAATEHEGPPAILKEDAKATEPIGDGHEVVATKDGIGKCSSSPCPVIHLAYAKELEAHPWAKKRNDEIQKLRKTNPAQAAKEAARFVKVLDMLKNRTGKGAGPKFEEPKVKKGEEAFGELSKEMSLKPVEEHPGGIRQTVADAVAAGFVNPDGSPKKVGGAFQPHGSAPTVRDELGITGKDAQSAHIGPTAALKKLSGYVRKDALTQLLPPQIHKQFDDHWKDWAHAQRRKGQTHATISELHKVVVEAIDQTPNMSPQTKGALAWQLHRELFQELGLHPDQKIELPFKKNP
jgi:hypothetical protein